MGSHNCTVTCDGNGIVGIPMEMPHGDRKSTRLNQSPCNLVCRLLLEKKTRVHAPLFAGVRPPDHLVLRRPGRVPPLPARAHGEALAPVPPRGPRLVGPRREGQALPLL